MRMTWVVLPVLALAVAAEEEPPAPLRLLGRLEPKKPAADAPAALWIQVGPTRYELLPDEAAAAAKLRGKFVEVAAAKEGAGEGVVTVRLEGKDPIVAQERRTIRGHVRASPEAERKTFPYAVEAEEGAFRVAARDARRFKKHVGGYVAAEGHVTSDGAYRQLEDVRAVDKALPPGARDPRKGDEAVAGRWTGTLLAETVPSGVPGVSAGDEFAVAFAAADGLEKVTGRLMDTYDVTGARMRKFSVKRRTVTFDLEYTFGSGAYSVRLEGRFAEDWKKLTGKWNSSFLGSGTFALDWAPAKG